MKGKKRFIIWMFPFFAAALFLLWQGKNLVMEEKEEQAQNEKEQEVG